MRPAGCSISRGASIAKSEHPLNRSRNGNIDLTPKMDPSISSPEEKEIDHSTNRQNMPAASPSSKKYSGPSREDGGSPTSQKILVSTDQSAKANNASTHDNKSSTGAPRNLKHLFSTSSSTNESSLTYKGQAALPRLPIPTLEETLQKFQRTVEPLLDEKGREEAAREIEKFRTVDGPVVQKALVEYEKAGFEAGTLGSYVEEFWNEAYLSPDESVVLNLNPFFVLEGGPDPKSATDQISRAASLTFATLKLASLLKEESLKPDTFRGKALCMDQFRVLFGSCRHPVTDHDEGACDDIHVYPESTHIVVLCMNQFYYFPVLWPDSNALALDERDIAEILRAIQNNAEALDEEEISESGIGGFTALPRSKWANIRESMCKFEVNEKSLQVIDSALFVLVLDHIATGDDINTCATNMLHGTNAQIDKGDYFQQQGTCLNRWYDKLQLIVCKSGCAGVNFEHSAIDGHTALRLVSDVYAETVISFAESITSLIHGRGVLPHVIDSKIQRAADVKDSTGRAIMDIQPKKLLFELTDRVRKEVFFAETALCDQMVGNDTHVLEFKDYGKSLIVGNRLSPDATVQMSILLAYYKLYGQVVCQYEPVLTKAFYHGRTEAMRPVTKEAKSLCEIWCSEDSTPEMKLEALRVATKEHSRLCKEAAQGKGVDRHLYALKCIAARKGMPIPEFYGSIAWKTLGHTILSTSNCGNPSLRHFGFGPVVPDGFGVGYIIKDTSLNYSVASKHRQTARYVRTLQTVLKEINALLEPLSNVSVADRPPSHSMVDPTTKSTENDFSYDDIYGEANVPKPPLTRKEAINAGENHRHRSSSGGRAFSIVKEQGEGINLDLAPHVVVDLS